MKIMNLETYYGFDRHNKEHLEKLKAVLALDGAKRWRAAAGLYLYLNPVGYVYTEDGFKVPKADARTEDAQIRQEVLELKKELDLAGNKMGLSKDANSGRRYALRMPAAMLQFIELIDPDVLSGTPQERKASVRKLIKAFPEYAVLTKI